MKHTFFQSFDQQYADRMENNNHDELFDYLSA